MNWLVNRQATSGRSDARGLADGAKMCSKMDRLSASNVARLADVCDRYRSKADVRPLLAEKLRPINQGKTRPESTLPISEFVDRHYWPFVEENYKPSTIAGYKNLWRDYIQPYLGRLSKR